MPEAQLDAGVADPRVEVEGRVDGLIDGLGSVGLAEIESVSLLGRFDRKFLLDGRQLEGLVGAFGPDGRVLEVEGRRATSYSSVYFDTDDLLTYRAHVQGRRNRFKVRTRHYGDPSATMLEVKLKGVRGRTEKHRCPHPAADPAVLDDASFEYLRTTVHDAYGVEPPEVLTASVVTSYRRTTLVDLAAGIRVTIDRDLRVADPRRGTSVALGDGLAIVETKSPSLRSPVERVLLGAGARPQRLSKYCMGVVALRPGVAGNRWRPPLRRLLPAES